MGKSQLITNENSKRIGFHYFQDTNHYTNHDLSTWLPSLQRLSASWVVLQSEPARAIPENFLTSLIKNGIEPIVQFKLPLPDAPTANDLKAILEAYARWGVKHVILFDKPNLVDSWSSSAWAQQDLVERFIDKFLPLALAVKSLGMTPVFPPLQPGGNYWDLVFLKQALTSIQRRGYKTLADAMGLAVYAYTFGHELSWGEGGSEKWANSIPYLTSADSQDQIGFNNYQWVNQCARKVLKKDLPIFMLGAGVKQPGKGYSPEIHAEVVQTIVRQLNGNSDKKAIPEYVKSCCFYLLCTEPDSPDHAMAWFKNNGESLPIVNILSASLVEPVPDPKKVSTAAEKASSPSESDETHPISHYLLLPVYEWGVSDWHLNVTQAFIRKHQPTIGFSSQEAMLAKKVTIIGGEQSFSEEILTQLRNSGCIVERISGDGTSIATQLAER